MRQLASLHLFCRVIDNFGDAGVCWRLARQLVEEYQLAVTLWLDNLGCLQRMCPELDAQADRQLVRGVVVRRWPDAAALFAPDEVADAVIEAFACDLPPAYLQAMAARPEKPLWLNLEYLSAEQWVDGCHALPSLHPSLPLSKYFFFPGFTERTGGLLRERDLLARRDAFQRDPQAMAAFFARLGVTVPAGADKVSLFCYPYAPLGAWFETLQAGDAPLVCLVPEGVASEAIGQFLGKPAQAGITATRGALTIAVLPFLEQDDYDRLLWACDVNFIRGEDSFVRAQWAARPFVWHIYAQQENAHVAKLDSFLGRYTERLPAVSALALTRFHLAWNGIRDEAGLPERWRELHAALPEIAHHAQVWAQKLSQSDDLATELMRFLRKIG